MSPRRDIRAPLTRRAACGRASCAARAAQLARYASLIIRGALTGVRRIIREATAELARINRPGLGPDTLPGQPRGSRARLVIAALARRHHRADRCC